MVIFYDKDGVVHGFLSGINEHKTRMNDFTTLKISDELAASLQEESLLMSKLIVKLENKKPVIKTKEGQLTKML